MTGPTVGPCGVPPPAASSTDGSGALALEPVPHPSGPVLLHATGEIDMVTAPFLLEQLRGWFATAPRVLLDLSAVTFLGSVGLSALLEAHRDALAGDVVLQLTCGDARQVRRVLQITGTMEHLDVMDPVPPATATGGAPPALFPVPGTDPAT
jgi:anti-sigma B factor antagonist